MSLAVSSKFEIQPPRNYSQKTAGIPSADLWTDYRVSSASSETLESGTVSLASKLINDVSALLTQSKEAIVKFVLYQSGTSIPLVGLESHSYLNMTKLLDTHTVDDISLPIFLETVTPSLSIKSKSLIVWESYLEHFEASEEMYSIIYTASSMDEDEEISEYIRSALIPFLNAYGQIGTEAISQLLKSLDKNRDTIAELLYQLGRVKHEITHNSRRRVLLTALKNNDLRVRDGAILGLSSMRDPYTIPALEKALIRETSASLQSDINQLLNRLKLLKESSRRGKAT